MAEPSSTAAPTGPAKPQAPPKPPNPVFKMMGLPNMRFKLPSRNWMIFLTVTGSFAGALIYDRREKRRSQQKWSELVAHIAKEPLAVEQMRRRLTIYLAAPPGDGLRVARDHFKEYVKPILTAAALDYTVVEGRREGDVRAGAAEGIRKLRRKAGESGTTTLEPGVDEVILATRDSIGITDESGPKGDIVIGRHAWKEYIRGLHEGWLGPMDAPAPPVEAPAETPAEAPATILESSETPMKDTAAGDAPSEAPEAAENKPEETKLEEQKPEEEKKEEKPSKPAGPAAAHIATADYLSAQPAPSLPQTFDSSVPIEFPHILGFLNTPIRVYRYLNQRHLAENIGREVAGIVLANASRPYRDESFSSASDSESSAEIASGKHEQQTALEIEEKSWHKSIYKRDEEDKEREWLDDIVLDERIASRMNLALLSPEDEARSQRIADQKEYILGEERPVPVSFWQHMWIKYGYGEDEETIRRKPIVGNFDGEFDQ
ncbi:Mitochondrial import inner membrane translocase subunit Tim54 [Penicillium angulare]|uniref:Mitochondrial import inner membrane translocase subunit Tim54 n=1 Tax=Penicillium angulare TaxID=116970 RepID=UPI002541A531|nr:Mitochondrial import inner membrane translocase subunit Tim54 [Penicillium angulare]KAJ5281011.1 Mitochondrial import inner membrane translocase subunit Tim54 [Penicillium angulare]